MKYQPTPKEGKIVVHLGGSNRLHDKQLAALKNAKVAYSFAGYTGSGHWDNSYYYVDNTPEIIKLIRDIGGTIPKQKTVPNTVPESEVAGATKNLVLETRDQEDQTEFAGVSIGGAPVEIMATPNINESYWEYRVKLYKDQAVVGFPKFGTVGIGFAKEKDWNTNLPYSSSAEEIVNHIWINRKYKEITRPQVVAAVKMIQNAIKTTKKKPAPHHYPKYQVTGPKRGLKGFAPGLGTMN